MGVRLSIFFCNSGNGRRDFFYDDDDDNEFRAVSMFFRSISGSFISLTRTLPHRTLPNGGYDQAKLEVRCRGS